MEDCDLDYEFNLYKDFYVGIGVNKNKEYFACLEWRNLGPFESREKAFEGICKHFYEEAERRYEKLLEIEKIAVSN